MGRDADTFFDMPYIYQAIFENMNIQLTLLERVFQVLIRVMNECINLSGIRKKEERKRNTVLVTTLMHA